MNEAEDGKAAAKSELRRRMNLSTADVPIVGVVTRLTHQKGIHLIKHAAWRTLERGGQFVLLGSAPDPRVQAEFNALAGDLGRQYPDRARLWFAYDEPLSHLIYAGCDMFLVPSVFEPCGLTQMIAMRWVPQAHVSVRQIGAILLPSTVLVFLLSCTWHDVMSHFIDVGCVLHLQGHVGKKPQCQ